MDFLKGFFEGELQANQSIFSTKDKYDKILEMISDEGMESVMMYLCQLTQGPNQSFMTYNGLHIHDRYSIRAERKVGEIC